ncbi:Baculoviral IAP repeat-containing protein 7 [Bulinus truncatus]|nr:Baculoviral IAP repeat-containing protein 7 [Bulinus truncatus]
MAHLRLEKCRLKTFLNTDFKYLKSPLVLAKAGFAKKENSVACVFCDLNCVNYDDLDSLDDFHKDNSPLCAMVTRKDCANVPFVSCFSSFDQVLKEIENTDAKAVLPSNVISTPSPNAILLPWAGSERVIVGRPKRMEYALKAKRDETFASWSSDFPVSSDDLSSSGFFYTGVADQVRCFYCGAGLEKWQNTDDAWVEHARCSPKCAYLRLRIGEHFIETVKNLYENNDRVSMTMVMSRMEVASKSLLLDKLHKVLRCDAAVQVLVKFGFQQSHVIEIAEALKFEGSAFTSETLYKRLLLEGRPCSAKVTTEPQDFDIGTLECIRNLTEENLQLRHQLCCKICLDKVLSVVFLPCGHLVSCTECATALNQCPLQVSRLFFISKKKKVHNEDCKEIKYNQDFESVTPPINQPESLESEIESQTSSKENTEGHIKIVEPSDQVPSLMTDMNTSSEIGHNISSNAPVNIATTQKTPPATCTQVPRDIPIHEQLGIITEKPKRPEFALKCQRIDTFKTWPRNHFLKPEDLSATGLYYTGISDCVRCFFCGGGLRDWEHGDDLWVEHAKWFPKCPYLRQHRSQLFIDTVQELKTEDKIILDKVIAKIGTAPLHPKDNCNDEIIKDPAVKAVIELGYCEERVLKAAALVKKTENVLSSESIINLLKKRIKETTFNVNCCRPSAEGTAIDPAPDVVDTLKEKNNSLRQQLLCKICMDKDVEIVFLPCGHLVSCTECASAMRDCPVCRKFVKGYKYAAVGEELDECHMQVCEP